LFSEIGFPLLERQKVGAFDRKMFSQMMWASKTMFLEMGYTCFQRGAICISMKTLWARCTSQWMLTNANAPIGALTLHIKTNNHVFIGLVIY